MELPWDGKEVPGFLPAGRACTESKGGEVSTYVTLSFSLIWLNGIIFPSGKSFQI